MKDGEIIEGYALSDAQYLAKIEKIKKSVDIPLSTCMYSDCKHKPIFSHVFQKESVLRNISTDGKVMAFAYRDLFTVLRDELPICYKEVGINNSFGFYGFCPEHDNSIFAVIEPRNEQVDWYDKHNQYLLGYRTLCREYYIQLATKRIFRKCLDTFVYPTELTFRYLQSISNCNASISIFNKYKGLFEDGIKNKNYSRYSFKVTELPFKLELCIASPINIREVSKGLYFGPDKNKITDTVNIIDIFPCKGRTIIIIGFLEGEKNLWATEIYQMLRSDDLEDICIALQDILFRSEFHCMSKELYNEIESEIPLFLQEWEKLLGCHNYALSYKSNIFRKYIKKLLGYNSD